MSEKSQGALITLLIILITPLSVFLQGVALRYLWGLYVTPVFEVDVPSLIACVGLSLFAAYLVNPNTHANRNNTNDDKKNTWVQFAATCIATIVYPLAVMFIGWLYSLFL